MESINWHTLLSWNLRLVPELRSILDKFDSHMFIIRVFYETKRKKSMLTITFYTCVDLPTYSKHNLAYTCAAEWEDRMDHTTKISLTAWSISKQEGFTSEYLSGELLFQHWVLWQKYSNKRVPK